MDNFSYENPDLAAEVAKRNAGSVPPGSDHQNSGLENSAHENVAAVTYNHTLACLRDVGRQLAEEQRVPFADMHDAMMRVMQPAEAGYGKTWPPRTSLRRPDRRAPL